jgi:hypothetical protein
LGNSKASPKLAASKTRWTIGLMRPCCPPERPVPDERALYIDDSGAHLHMLFADILDPFADGRMAHRTSGHVDT